MNEWAQESIELANAPEYLDRLSEVYPVTREAKRGLSSKIKAQLKDAYDERDGTRLVRALLELGKFLIKDPYVAFLRRENIFLAYNPNVVDRLAQTLFSMNFDELISGCEEPTEFNRQIGTLFRNWLPKLGYPFLFEDKLDKYPRWGKDKLVVLLQ